MGFKVSATRQLTKDTLKVLERPITLNAGRGIYATENPAQSAQVIQRRNQTYLGLIPRRKNNSLQDM